jgi:hypothetical protein
MERPTKKTVSPKTFNAWIWRFTRQAQTWNGRLTLLGFVAALLTELLFAQGMMHFWDVI